MLRFVVLVVSLVVALVSAQVRTKEGGLGVSSKLIVGGTNIDIQKNGYLTYLASTYIDPSTGENLYETCSGSLIQSDPVAVVLTAAHCGNPQDGFIRRRALVGSYNASVLCLNEPSCRMMDVTDVLLHPEYNQTFVNMNYGLALEGFDAVWVLRPYVRPANETYYNSSETRSITDIPTIPINMDPNFPPLGQTTEALGYGFNDIGGNNGNVSAPEEPQITTLRVQNNYDCERAFGISENATDKVGCILGMSMPGGYRSAVCNGDSGGPNLVQGKLWGITSFGPPDCSDPNVPAVVTKVS